MIVIVDSIENRVIKNDEDEIVEKKSKKKWMKGEKAIESKR
jgi:hypothetical protein